MGKLGRLERVELRKIWSNEASHFTPWVAENVDLLSDTIGLSLELEQIEKPVGSFSADILCRDTTTSKLVLIENQIERTDHSHLGQTITYAAGIGVSTVIWIASEFREEHRAALDWLNEHSDEDYAFFGLEIEAWRIGESQVAPKFNVVCKPNDWTRQVHAAASSAGTLSEVNKQQIEFWGEFSEFARKVQSPVRGYTTPKPYNWIGHPVGKSGMILNSVWSQWNSEKNAYDGGEIREELILSTGTAKSNFAKLLDRKEEIESALKEAGISESIHWYNPDDAQLCRIYVRKNADVSDREDWSNQQKWLLKRAEAFLKVFAPAVRAL